MQSPNPPPGVSIEIQQDAVRRARQIAAAEPNPVLRAHLEDWAGALENALIDTRDAILDGEDFIEAEWEAAQARHAEAAREWEAKPSPAPKIPPSPARAG